MAGPGGGGAGGGFRGGGGGSFGGFTGGGGSFGGGGYHGHHHRGPRFYGPGLFGFFPMWRRPYYGGYYGGGCLGGLAGLIIMPVLIIVLAVVMLFSSVGEAFSAVANGGVVQYDEMKFQSYAAEQYSAAFDDNENNILLLFALDEERERPYIIAWVGDYLDRRITGAFGDQRTKFGQTVDAELPTNYDNALTISLSNIAAEMAEYIDDLGLESSFKYGTRPDEDASSYLVNRSTLSINETTVNMALEEFTEITEIPIVIAVAEAEEVFGKSIPIGSWITIILAIAMIGFAVWFIIKGIKARREAKGQNNYTNGRNSKNSDGGYNGDRGGDWYNNGN